MHSPTSSYVPHVAAPAYIVVVVVVDGTAPVPWPAVPTTVTISASY